MIAQYKTNFEFRRPFEPRGAARELWVCRDEEILIEGPAGTGKTRGVCEKMHYCAQRYPGYRGLMVRKTRESLTNTVLVTFEQKVVPANDPILEGPQRNLRQSYRYPNGSEIVVGGMDNPQKVMSSEYDQIGEFEATELNEEDHENLTTRLRNWVMPYQQIIADCNPSGPNHWLNRRPEKKQMTRLLSRHQDNPVYYDYKTILGTGERVLKPTKQGLAYLAKLERLSGVRRLRLFQGKWAAAEGLVYEEWDPDIHLVDRIVIPEYWRKYRSIDFGFKNPFVCQWWALDDDDNAWMYREIYLSHKIVADHAEVINKYSEGEKYEATICDHDLEDRQTLHANGIFTIPAYKDVRTGIDAVEDRLRVKRNEMAGLHILRDSLVERDELLVDSSRPVCTSYEFESYVYKKAEDGKPIKEEPVKKDDHGMDAMRYFVAHVDNVGGMVLRAVGAQASAVK